MNTVFECLGAAHANDMGLPPPERCHRDFPIVMEMEKVLVQTAMLCHHTKITKSEGSNEGITVICEIFIAKKNFFVQSDEFLRKNSLPVLILLIYTANMWYVLEVDENIVT